MKRIFNGAIRLFSTRFKPTLGHGEYKVTPARETPGGIPRPPYVGDAYHARHNLVLDPIEIKQPETLHRMEAAGKVVAKAIKNALAAVKEGVTTDALDEIVHNTITQARAYPSPIDYYGFPKSVCISVNEVLVHGIPDLRPLQKGDYLNIDSTCFLSGVHSDSSAMAIVGEVHPDVLKLVNLVRQGRYWILRKHCMKL